MTSKEQWKKLVEHHLARFIGYDYNPVELMLTVNQILHRMQFERFYVHHDNDPNMIFSGLTVQGNDVVLVWEALDKNVFDRWVIKSVDYRKKRMYSDYGFEMVK